MRSAHIRPGRDAAAFWFVTRGRPFRPASSQSGSHGASPARLADPTGQPSPVAWQAPSWPDAVGDATQLGGVGRLVLGMLVAPAWRLGASFAPFAHHLTPTLFSRSRTDLLSCSRPTAIVPRLFHSLSSPPPRPAAASSHVGAEPREREPHRLPCCGRRRPLLRPPAPLLTPGQATSQRGRLPSSPTPTPAPTPLPLPLPRPILSATSTRTDVKELEDRRVSDA